jgi:hypothetical protein
MKFGLNVISALCVSSVMHVNAFTPVPQSLSASNQAVFGFEQRNANFGTSLTVISDVSVRVFWIGLDRINNRSSRLLGDRVETVMPTYDIENLSPSFMFSNPSALTQTHHVCIYRKKRRYVP